MTVIYRQVEVVVAVQTTTYGANRTLHEEASFPSPDPTREWQVDYVTLQLLTSSGGSNFTILFYRGATGLAINDTGFPAAIVDLGGLRVDGAIRLTPPDSVSGTGDSNRILSVTPSRRLSISIENGIYKFQTITSSPIALTTATVKFVIGLVSGG